MRSVIAAVVVSMALVGFCDDGGCPISKNVRGHENTEWSNYYGFDLVRGPKLPRVLLVGDSICSQYKDKVRSLLKGKMNVSYWISSYCVSSRGFLQLLDFYLNEAPYDVIHFNNGMHSLSTPVASWEKSLQDAFELIRRKQPKAKLVWVTTTPLAKEKDTQRVVALNDAAQRVIRRVGVDGVNDLFALDNPLDRKTYWSDEVHHKSALSEKEAAQVVESILKVLPSAVD